MIYPTIVHKSQFKMFILSYTKITKCECFWRYEITILRFTYLLFENSDPLIIFVSL
jgi:hypothetical protein